MVCFLFQSQVRIYRSQIHKHYSRERDICHFIGLYYHAYIYFIFQFKYHSKHDENISIEICVFARWQNSNTPKIGIIQYYVTQCRKLLLVSNRVNTKKSRRLRCRWKLYSSLLFYLKQYSYFNENLHVFFKSHTSQSWCPQVFSGCIFWMYFQHKIAVDDLLLLYSILIN